MDREQRIAFINSQILCAQARIEGMIAANQERLANGYTVAYGDEDFAAIPEEYGLTHNQVIEYLRQD